MSCLPNSVHAMAVHFVPSHSSLLETTYGQILHKRNPSTGFDPQEGSTFTVKLNVELLEILVPYITRTLCVTYDATPSI